MMKCRKSGWIDIYFIVLIIVLSMLIGCGGQPESSSVDQPVTTESAAPPEGSGNFSVFFPQLLALKGWNSEPPTGMNMGMADVKMTYASRSYTKPDAGATAMVMLGNPDAISNHTGLNIETDLVRASTSQIDGFKVQRLYDKETHSGSIVVYLIAGQKDYGAVFIFAFDGMDEQQALELAKSYDWEKLKTLTNRIQL